MKLLRYGAPGSEQAGILDEDGNIRSLHQHVEDISGACLSQANLAKLQKLDTTSLPLVDGSPRIGACVGKVGKLICIGLNYADHAKETGAKVPDEPVVFMKATSAICGPNDNIIKPPSSIKMDWEVELGLVIGEEARYVNEEEAMDYLAGYCVVHDISERNFQLERGGQWDKGKGCDTFGPIGPWLVSKDEIPQPQKLALTLSVNGKQYQNGNTSTMVFGPAELISYVSQFMSLQPGDIISTGTPPGVGMGQNPPVYLEHGDQVELEVEGLGVQKQKVVPYTSK